MKIDRAWLILFILFSSLGGLSSQDSSPETPLALADFISTACKNSHFQELLINELYFQYEEDLAIPYGELVFNLSAGYNLKFPATETSAFFLDVSLAKLFALSGTEISGSYALSQSTRDSTYTSRLGVKIAQEIIQNAFGNTAKMRKDLAGVRRQLAEYQIIEAYEDYFAVLVSLYYKWCLSYENVKNTALSLKDAQDLLTRTQERAKYGIASKSDINKSKLQVLTRRETLLKSQLDLRQNLLRIREAMNFPDDRVQFVPVFQPVVLEKPRLQSLLESTQTSGRTVRILETLQNIADLSVKIAYDSLLPTASLYLEYTVSGDDLVLYPGTNHELTIGIDLKIPVTGPASRAEYALKQRDLEKSRLSARNKTLELKRDLNLLLESILSVDQLLALTSEKLAISAELARDEEKNYSKGTTSFSDLLAAYNTLEANRFSQNNYLIQLSLYYIEWLRLSDSLVSENKTPSPDVLP